MNKLNVKKLLFTVVLVIILGTTILTSCITFTRDTTTPVTIEPTTTTTTPTATPNNTTTTSTTSSTWAPQTGNNPINIQLNSLADAIEIVKPAVVAINTEVVGFNIFNQSIIQEGAGSGWIIDPNGIIVTNNHVIEEAKTITVTTDDGNSYIADMKNVFTDPYTDLAVIKIDAKGLPSLKTGKASALRLGDWVIAIGNALGQGTRVTEGIISRKDVSLEIDQNDTLYNLIETSAAINPGNSGGPLVNLNGEVIGITSAKISSVGVEGMGYAISIDAATPVIQELVNKGYVTRPFIGVSLYDVSLLTNSEKRQFNVQVDKGVLIYQVSQGGPASQAGLRAGDVVVGIGGKDISTTIELTKILHSAEIGKPLEIKYWRGNNQATAIVTPIEAPRSS